MRSQRDEVRKEVTPIKTVLSWSSGKDCATALSVLRDDPGIEVVGLLTTVNEVHDRVAMHAVRRDLLQRQADAVGLPLRIVNIPSPCTNEQYEAVMSNALAELKAQGVEQMAFGDLLLEDIRDYREKQMAATGIKTFFPLWKRDTTKLAQEIIANGTKAVITCVDPKVLDASFAGRQFDDAFLNALPSNVDPCGENGEFHTFVYDGPMFKHPLQIQVGDIVERDGFVFADVTERD